jgi:hypothetical protein
MAPEVLAQASNTTGKSVYGKPADLWSLFVIFWEMATGSPPTWQTHDFADIASTIPSEYSPAVTAILKRMFHKLPERRPTAEELISLIHLHVHRDADAAEEKASTDALEEDAREAAESRRLAADETAEAQRRAAATKATADAAAAAEAAEEAERKRRQEVERRQRLAAEEEEMKIAETDRLRPPPNVGGEQLEALMQRCGVNASDTTWDFYNKGIGDAGAVVIAGALAMNTTVTVVGLGRNQITDTGKSALRAAWGGRNKDLYL